MLWDINFLVFCVSMYIAKRHYEDTKKVWLILVKERLFSILWTSLILLNSNTSEPIIKRGAYSNE